MTPEPKRYPLRLELPSVLEKAIAALQVDGGVCRIVGGSVRDALIGLEPKDFDVEVYGLGLETIAAKLAKLGRTDLVGKAFAVVKLWAAGQEYDFSIPRRESKKGSGHRGFEILPDANMHESEALKRRDFTINALLYDHASQEILDYYGGKKDLELGILRHVSPAFSEDPLRVLRGMQFAGRFRLQLDPETAALCRSIRREFHDLPSERVWGEWEKWASRSSSPAYGMRVLQQSGWLPHFPELNALVGLPQDPEWHPEGDVWTHTLCCLDALARDTDWAALSASQRALLSFSVLCHDLGKARCTRWAEKRGSKRWISPGHDNESVWLSQQFLESMRAPHALTAKVMTLAGNHHFLNTVPEQGHSDASLRRLSKRLQPATTEELIYLMTADHRGRPPFISEEQDQRIEQFRQRIQELDLKASAPKQILLGRHLIDRGLPPGVGFKAILEDAFEAQLEGEFCDDVGAISWLDAYLEREKKNA